MSALFRADVERSVKSVVQQGYVICVTEFTFYLNFLFLRNQV